jgi:hypothetical protein
LGKPEKAEEKCRIGQKLDPLDTIAERNQSTPWSILEASRFANPVGDAARNELEKAIASVRISMVFKV